MQDAEMHNKIRHTLEKEEFMNENLSSRAFLLASTLLAE